MTAIEILRMAAARSNAIRRYAEAYDRHSENEQIARLTGNEADEAAAHDAVVVAYVAWRAEIDDVKPEGLP